MNKIFIGLVAILMAIAFAGCDTSIVLGSTQDEPTQDEPTQDEPTQDEPTQEDPSPYPTIIWTNDPNHFMSSSRSIITTDPSAASFFDWKGLDFAATYGTETGTFGITDSSLATLINFNTGLLSGSVSFFSGHTMEIDMLWHDTDGNYYEETYTMSIDPVNGWGVVLDTVNTPSIVDAGMMDYEIAFKEIRFIAEDLTNYYTWTNPDL